MCGIAGIYQTANAPLPGDCRKIMGEMLAKMRYRGPDGEGIWLDGPVCLGHRRLSIIDLAGGSQPMLNSDKTLCVVFNGEIYNFQELRAKLQTLGQSFLTNSDTEVILAAYARYGTDCLEYLEGMFAFAIWDIERQRLFCARDHFGKKPFYYTCQNGLFAFSSELRPLAENPLFSFHLSPQALMRYLAYEYAPVPQSMYQEVSVLPPSGWLLIDSGKITTGTYWELPWPENGPVKDEAILCEELRSLMERAVRLRMISDVPLGVFLSGGIDSSIVAGLMARQSSTPIQTFSIGFREASYDESRYAKLVAGAFHTDHHERVLSADDCARELPGIVSKMDTPMADASCAPTWLLAALAREHVTVALGGDGADEFWAGYEHYIGYRIAGWYNRLPRWLQQGIKYASDWLPSSAGYINPRLALKTFLKGAASPDWLRVQTMLTALDGDAQRLILTDTWLNRYADNGAFLDPGTLFAPTREWFERWQPADVANPLERAFHVYIRQFLLDDILVKVDRCSMLHSLEVRSPFLDREVTRFAARLPVNMKLHGFKRKYLLKKAFADLLPKEILERNKRGFQIPVAAWLRGALKPLLLELCSRQRLARQGIFNGGAVAAMMERHFSGKEDLRKQLWTLLVFQIWLEATGASF